MATNLVCIDSMICVWGIKRQASEDQQHMIKKTETFLNWLDEQKRKVLIPSPIITEILAPIDDINEREKIMNKINAGFIIGSLDAIASIKAGEIWNKRSDWREIYKEGTDILKNRFKFDTLILGIAITKNVDVFYTEDDKLKKIGQDYLQVESVPNLPSQLELNIFDEEQ
jgi:predicted nucleic acid-binding protein